MDEETTKALDGINAQLRDNQSTIRVAARAAEENSRDLSTQAQELQQLRATVELLEAKVHGLSQVVTALRLEYESRGGVL